MGETILGGGIEPGAAGLWLYGSCDFTAKIGKCGAPAARVDTWFVSPCEFFFVFFSIRIDARVTAIRRPKGVALWRCTGIYIYHYAHLPISQSPCVTMSVPTDWHWAIFPRNISTLLRYFEIHLDELVGPLAPGTMLCGHVVRNVGAMSPQDLHVIIPRGWIPPGFDFPPSSLWACELPLNLQYVGYVSALPSTGAWFFHHSMYVDICLKASPSLIRAPKHK
jgi:hypothetical protein